VVLDDVAGGADAVVVPGTTPHADVLRHRDLHVVDVVAVPDGFVQLVRETQREDVLHGLFAEVVVDTEDRVGGERALHHLVQLPRRGEVVAERLLDDDTTPPRGLLVSFADEAGGLELRGDQGERLRRDREVVRVVTHRAPLDVELVDGLAKTSERLGIIELALDEADAFEQLLPGLLAELGPGVLLDRLVHDLREVLILPVAPGETHERESGRQQTAVGEVVHRRHELLARQVSRHAEDHQGARTRDAIESAILGIAEGIVTG